MEEEIDIAKKVNFRKLFLKYSLCVFGKLVLKKLFQKILYMF